MSTTSVQLQNRLQLSPDHQNAYGFLFVILKLLERCEAEGYSSSGDVLADLRAICGTPTSGVGNHVTESCHAIAQIAQLLGAR